MSMFPLFVVSRVRLNIRNYESRPRTKYLAHQIDTQSELLDNRTGLNIAFSIGSSGI
jgi:hypothetical protein